MRRRHPATVLLAILLATASAGLLLGQQVHVFAYPEMPPGFEEYQWPPAPWPACSRGGAPVPGGLSNGAIRSVGDKWEVLAGGDLAQWAPFDPRDARTSQLYYHVGPAWVKGECTSNIHGEAQSWLAELEGISTLQLRLTRPMEATDLDYFQPWVDEVRRRYCVRFPVSCGSSGGGEDPAPTPTPTPHQTVCRPPCTLRGGGICDCPSPQPTPTPQPMSTPRPTPTPAATPCPIPAPCPSCPPTPQPVRMPAGVRATLNKGLSSLGKQWKTSVSEARRWLDEHPFYVPNDGSSSGQLTLTLEPDPPSHSRGAGH